MIQYTMAELCNSSSGKVWYTDQGHTCYQLNYWSPWLAILIQFWLLVKNSKNWSYPRIKNSVGVGFKFFHLIELANDIEASCTFGQYWMILPADHILLNSFPMWKWKMVKYQINCFSCCCKFCAKGHCPTSLKLDCKFYLGLTIYLYRITKKCTGIMNKS